ncbi:MAG TPA: hypothetical protein DD412_00770 [Holosporales bacterium]|nr:hypothetical protein [Holosporales bacterium]
MKKVYLYAMIFTIISTPINYLHAKSQSAEAKSTLWKVARNGLAGNFESEKLFHDFIKDDLKVKNLGAVLDN